jgi:hypothetical protein
MDILLGICPFCDESFRPGNTLTVVDQYSDVGIAARTNDIVYLVDLIGRNLSQYGTSIEPTARMTGSAVDSLSQMIDFSEVQCPGMTAQQQ